MSAQQQYFQALQCPICQNIFVESLWSLISHLQTSHAEQSSFKLSIGNLERVKKYVPRNCVSVIRPAFTEEGKPTDFLNMLMSHSSSPSDWNAASTSQSNCSYSAELRELSWPVTKTCKQCGEIVSEPTFSSHVCSNLNNPFHTLDFCDAPSTSSAPTSNKDEHQKVGKTATVFAPINDLNYPTKPIAKPAEPFPNTMSSILSEMSAPASTTGGISIIDRRRKRFQQNSSSTTTIKPPVRGNAQLVSNKRASASKISALVCSQCGKTFENRCKLTRHLIDHKMEQSPYRCPFPICLQSYDSRLKFRNHLLRVHKQISEEEITILLEEGDKVLIRLRENNGSRAQAPETELNPQIATTSSSMPANTGSSDVEFANADANFGHAELLTPKQEMEL